MLERNPKDYGYQEAGWHVNLLKDYFKQQGISACDNTIIKALRKQGYVFKRFARRIPDNTLSSAAKKAAINVMVDEMQQLDPANTEIFFEDESHFSNQPYVSRGWFKKGRKKPSQL